jgi:hypothetical protein
MIPNNSIAGGKKADNGLEEDTHHYVPVHLDLNLRVLGPAIGRVHHHLGVVARVNGNTIDAPCVPQRAPSQQYLVDVYWHL